MGSYDVLWPAKQSFQLRSWTQHVLHAPWPNQLCAFGGEQFLVVVLYVPWAKKSCFAEYTRSMMLSQRINKVSTEVKRRVLASRKSCILDKVRCAPIQVFGPEKLRNSYEFLFPGFDCPLNFAGFRYITNWTSPLCHQPPCASTRFSQHISKKTGR